jgi:hypothetical protein
LVLPAAAQYFHDEVPDVDATASVAVLEALAFQTVDALAQIIHATARRDDRTAVGQPFHILPAQSGDFRTA